ncbi:MAG: dihydroorotate dehydrogenase electron transfer subunit [Desulfuromonas sp.]|nr:MAG: dihydroorotate dehydrogenase electron transfer subunit [Desulfuromonas sp.]
MKNLKTVVLSNQEISPGYYRMRILAPDYTRLAKAGQFIMFRVQRSLLPLLRRPFGIFRTGFMPADCETMPPKEFIEIIYKVVGGGTEIMRELHHGDSVEILGPLGNGFEFGEPGEEKVLVGGGIGLVPLYMLAEKLVEESRVRLYMGGRTRDDIITVTEFERLGVRTHVSTEDGSVGDTGLVTVGLEKKLQEGGKMTVYACGPMPMIEAVEKICRRYGVPLQVSLEALMACGVGACLGCVVKGAGHSDSTPSYLCTCKVGPVFDAKKLDWGNSPEQSVGNCGGCQ